MIKVAVQVTVIIAAALLIAYCNQVSARHYLQHRYANVGRVHMQIFQFSCYRTKSRMKFDFTATRADGTKVGGYLCYDGPFDFWPVIHETR